MTAQYERRSVISGVGISAVGRRLGRSELDLTVEACRAAIGDAGLSAAEIDGIVAWPGEAPAPPGFAGPSAWRTLDALGLSVSWHSACGEGPGQLAAVMTAAMAVGAGLCRHVLVYRTVAETSGQPEEASHPADAGGVTGALQWLRPFGSLSPVHWVALMAQRYLHDYGATREQIAWLPVTIRAHAARSPHAVYRAPITVQDYLAARMIASPLGLYDCDVPVDGSVAVIVSTAGALADIPRPVTILAAGSAMARGRSYWDQFSHATDMAAHDAARHMWSRTDLKPADVDVAQVYDGFSFTALAWLEALGFCGPGEAAGFVAGGTRIRIGGELPLNTGGGQLSGGRLGGFGLLYEACLQVRRQAEARQVPGAQVAVVGTGAGPLGGCLLLGRA